MNYLKNILECYLRMDHSVLLYSITLWVVTTFVVLFRWKRNDYSCDKKKIVAFIFLDGYVLFLLTYLVLARDESAAYHYQTTLFWSYQKGMTDYSYLVDNFLNILIFVPVCFVIAYIWNVKLGIFVGVLISILIEVSQLTLRRGVFEFDDIINNAVGCIVGGLLYMALSNRNKKINTMYIRLQNEALSGIRIALVADLHDHNPIYVIEALERDDFDMILMPGDILERNNQGIDPRQKYRSTKQDNNRLVHLLFNVPIHIIHLLTGWDSKARDIQNGYRLLKNAAKIAPTFLSNGNHEWQYSDDDLCFFTNNGIKYLDNSASEICIKEKCIYVGGLSVNYDLDFLKEFSTQNKTKILMCHHPEYYDSFIAGKDGYNYDLIVCGHTHGGQWKIFGRGLFASGQGIFPHFCHGVYDNNGNIMIVTSGCAKTSIVPRIGNPCEIVKIEFD